MLLSGGTTLVNGSPGSRSGHGKVIDDVVIRGRLEREALGSPWKKRVEAIHASPGGRRWGHRNRGAMTARPHGRPDYLPSAKINLGFRAGAHPSKKILHKSRCLFDCTRYRLFK